MAHLLEVDIEKTLIFQGITLDIIGRVITALFLPFLQKSIINRTMIRPILISMIIWTYHHDQPDKMKHGHTRVRV